MVAAWRLTGAKFVTVEAQEASVALARKSARYNGLEDRFDIRLGDFREEGVIRAGEKFDLVFGSPPYFPLGTGVEGDHPQKIACRFETRGGIEDYCFKAVEHLSLGGWFACVFPEEQRSRVEAAATAGGLRIVRRRAVIAREGEPPLLTLFAMLRSDHLPATAPHTWEEPPLIIRRADGTVHPEYAAVKLSFGFPP
jgi:tRNA1(Val) A37 N6-methylase TrmN6